MCPTALRMTLVVGSVFEVATTMVAVGLHVADGGTAPQFAFDAANTPRFGQR
jgi:hypothetical protein